MSLRGSRVTVTLHLRDMRDASQFAPLPPLRHGATVAYYRP